ncbi:MAG: hypothetical protein ABFS19_06795 [Thermodesulfobacteriota bacterium]
MIRFKFVLYLLAAVFISGCGQTVVETLHVPTSPNPDAPGKGRTVVILPFADYTYADSISAAYRRNMSITEALTDRFVANGFGLPIQEDVFSYMVNQQIINIVSYENKGSVSMSNELSNEWSSVMKDKIRGYMNDQQKNQNSQIVGSPGTHALNQKTVAKIGRRFNADYIIRGRILEFKTRQEHTWAPWKRGILPFVSGITSQTMYGFASSDTYDNWNQMLAGGTWGAIIGHNAGGPWEPDGGTEIFGISGGADANAIFWGTVGAQLGKAAKNSGRVDQAVVQMRIWVQEAATGNLIWTNRVDVKVSPESILADGQYDALFDKAIHKSVNTLIDNFVTYGL